MKINKQFISLLCGFTSFLVFSSASLPAKAQKTGLGIAAVINDDVISVLDLESRVSMVLDSTNMNLTQENRARVRPQVLRSLIDEKLMQQEATRLDIKITEKDIEDRLKTIAGGNNMTIQQLSNRLLSVGVPISTLKSRIETESAWQVYVFRKLAQSIKISEDEITDEINRIQANAGKPEYLLAEIFIPVEKPSQDQEIRLLAQRLLQEMQKGALFPTLANNFSRASSAQSGGDMGWVQINHLPNELQDAVRQLKPGQVSIPIRSIGGYYLIFLRNVRSSPGLAAGKTFLKISQLHVSTQNSNDPAVINATAQKLVNFTRSMNNCDQMDSSKSRPDFPFKTSPLSGSMGEISLSSLPQNMQAVIAPLAIGQPSQPIPTGGGVAVMMVCERNDEALNMDEAREKVSESIRARRLEIAARRRLLDLRRDAFVDIRQ